MVQEDFGFDCKCPVCSGEVPNQDDIVRKMADITSNLSSKEEEDMTLLDWTREANGLEAIVDLDKSMYMGSPEGKMARLLSFLFTAVKARNPALIGKAMNGIKELAENLGLEALKRGC